ncbi:MAG: hypothetical protein CM1200mP41_20400 [Gammaproteobacteria bacterium]|nr:MAG: hypothetical protein CM1200mP41_20400 [Gammaproteobacteria bacterium]
MPPIPVPDAEVRALKMTIAMREAFEELREVWNRRGYELGCCWGVASGYATIGVIGFEERLDYTARGNRDNLAARLCDTGADTEILVTKRLMAKLDNQFLGTIAVKLP